MTKTQTKTGRYSEDLKRKALHALANRGDKTVDTIVEKFGLSGPALLYQWRAKEQAQQRLVSERIAAAASPEAIVVTPPAPATNGNGNGNGHGHDTALDALVDDPADMRRQIVRLETENAELRAWVKKLL